MTDENTKTTLDSLKDKIKSVWTKRLFLVLGLGVIIAGAWLAPLDTRAAQVAEAGLKRALVTFATARALNAIISVVQGTEVAVQPAGVGVIFTPGQVLDPINDLVEQFSSLMLAASIAFGIELALIKLGGYWAVSAGLTAFAVVWVGLSWRESGAPGWLTKIFVGLLLVRFAIPVVVLGSEAGFKLFLEKDYMMGQSTIEMSSSKLAGLAPPMPATRVDEGIGSGLQSGLKHWWAQGGDIGKKIDELKGLAGKAVEHIVKLIVVFIMQTLVVPILLLWGLIRAGRMLVMAEGRKWRQE